MKDWKMTPCMVIALFCGAIAAFTLFVGAIAYWIITTV